MPRCVVLNQLSNFSETLSSAMLSKQLVLRLIASSLNLWVFKNILLWLPPPMMFSGSQSVLTMGILIASLINQLKNKKS